METDGRKNSKNQGGFTIIELVTIIVITGVMVGILSQLMIFGADSFEFIGNRKASLHESRMAVHYLNRDFRKVRDMQSISIASNHQFQFQNYNNNQIDYRFINSKIERNSSTLAMNVSQFQFNYIRSDGGYMAKPVTADSLEFIWDIEARFTVTVENQATEYRVYVHPRNYK